MGTARGKGRKRGGEAAAVEYEEDDDSVSELSEILKEIREFRSETTANFGSLKKEVNELRESIGQLNIRMDTAESRISESEDGQITMTNVLLHSLRLQKQLEERCELMESHSRKLNLRIHSVAEKLTEGSDMVEFVKKIIRDKLDIGSEEISIAAAHRIGKKTGTEDRPRSIIVRFQNENMKQLVLRTAWAKKDLTIGDKTVSYTHLRAHET